MKKQTKQASTNLKLKYLWFAHDVTKIQTTKLLIFLRGNFHDL